MHSDSLHNLFGAHFGALRLGVSVCPFHFASPGVPKVGAHLSTWAEILYVTLYTTLIWEVLCILTLYTSVFGARIGGLRPQGPSGLGNLGTRSEILCT